MLGRLEAPLSGRGLLPRLAAELRKEAAWPAALGALAGGCGGVAAAAVVECTLVELSLSAFFSGYLGLVFVAVGAALAWRVQAGAAAAAAAAEEEARPRQLLLLLAGLVAAAGLLCLLQQQRGAGWLLLLPAPLRVLAFALLGVAVAFALAFSLVDVVNLCCCCCSPAAAAAAAAAAAPLHAPQQASLVLLFALPLGGLAGARLGLLSGPTALHFARRPLAFSAPLGALLGALAGAASVLLRRSLLKLNYDSPQFDEDI